MCGRFTLTATVEQLVDRFEIEYFSENDMYTPSYNIAPSQSVIAVINDGLHNKMGYLKWGLIPAWSKDASIGHKLINARSETLLEKPSFRMSYRKKRCLILADSFFEWKREGEKKVPMRIKLKSDESFAMAGLWEKWQPSIGQAIFTCTVITTNPNSLVENIHDRMPVILNKEDEKVWLNPAITDTQELKKLLVPLDEDLMEAYEVSSLVNSPKNNSIELIHKVF